MSGLLDSILKAEAPLTLAGVPTGGGSQQSQCRHASSASDRRIVDADTHVAQQVDGEDKWSRRDAQSIVEYAYVVIATKLSSQTPRQVCPFGAGGDDCGRSKHFGRRGPESPSGETGCCAMGTDSLELRHRD